MKIFFYKVLLVFVFFILSIHFSYGLIKKKITNEILNLSSKENVEHLKNKIREEIKNGSNKKILIEPEDVKLINRFYNKIRSDLQNYKEEIN
jgi:regulatory protein YycI of two-component signal transduction system YycFG